jgi:hypothetical protein
MEKITMPFDTAVEVPSEVSLYNERWQRLLAHVHSGIPLHEQVRSAITEWGRKVKPETKVATEPEKRFEEVQARVAALSTHFAEVVGTVTVWMAGLQPLMDACSASLDGLPLRAAIDEVHSAFARAENRRLPERPHLDLNDPASLERRARWLREVAEVMVRVEGGPRDIGAALRNLEAVLARFNQELESVKGMGRKGNVSAIRWLIPIHPALGAPAPAPKPAQRKDEFEFMYR